MDLAFHPSRPLLAAALITGAVELFSYSPSDVGPLTSLQLHAQSCRAVRFLGDSTTLASAGSDGCLLFCDAETGRRKARVKAAHEAAINRLQLVDEHVVAAGDDEGHVRLWDSRSREQAGGWRVHEDFVADLCHVPARGTLLSASGDGTLAILDLRAGCVSGRSDNQEDELLSVVSMKRGRKIVCGSQEGVLDIFDASNIEDISDRFPGHPASVDALLPLDEDTVLTGASDGLIRIISLQPNKMLGVVGEHSDWPLERLACAPDGRTLASASHDNTVKLWDIAFLREGSGVEEAEVPEPAAGGAADAEAAAEEEEEEEEEEAKEKKHKRKRRREKAGAASVAGSKRKGGGRDPGFFKGLL